MMNGTETTSHQQITAPMPDAAARGPRRTQMEVFMNSRYLTNALLAVVGGFTVIASQVWVPATFMWLMFSAGVLAIIFSSAIALKGRGLVQRGLDSLIAILGAWTVVASLVFTGSVVTWLGFGSGAAFAALAFIGLTLHELYTERVVHSIEVRAGADRELSGIGA
jgi:hypothetical protein